MTTTVVWSPKARVALLAVCAVAGLFVRIGDAPLGFDDVYYAQKAREMVQRGDWLFLYPTHGGELSIDNKPPMLFWALGLVGRLFGFQDWAMRLVPAVFGFALVWVVYAGVTRLMEERVGWAAAFILLFTQQFLQYARSATMETMYLFFTVLGLAGFWAAYRGRDERWYLGVGAAFGLAAMTRQILVLLPVAGVLVFLLLRRDSAPLHSPWFYAGVAVFCAIVVPWHAAMWAVHGAAFAQPYFGVAARAVAPVMGSWDEYVRKIAENYWPWLPLLIAGIWRLWALVRRCGVRSDEAAPAVFVLTGTFVPLLLLHLFRTKAPQYALVVYPWFAVIAAWMLVVWDTGGRVQRVVSFAGFGLACAWVLTPLLPRTLDSREHVDSVALADAVRGSMGELTTPAGQDAWHFINGLRYYAGVNPQVRSWEEIESAVAAGKAMRVIARERDLQNRVGLLRSAQRVANAHGSVVLYFPERMP